MRRSRNPYRVAIRLRRSSHRRDILAVEIYFAWTEISRVIPMYET